MLTSVGKTHVYMIGVVRRIVNALFYLPQYQATLATVQNGLA